MSSLSIQPLSVPSGTPTPRDVNSLIALIAQYLEIEGVQNYSTIVVGTLPPDADQEDAIWLAVDTNGQPESLKVYNGTEWVELQFRIPFGKDRPSNPSPGDKFYDTSIEQELVYMNGSWRTAWGGKGQRIFVHASSKEQAVERYPGWAIDEDAMGLFIRGCDSDLSAGETGGAATVTLTKDNLPAHTHTVPNANSTGRDGDDGSPVVGVHKDTPTKESSSVGADKPFDIIPPFICFWVLKRL